MLAGAGVELEGHWRAGLRPDDSGYAASVYAVAGLQAIFAAITAYLAAFAGARALAGRLAPDRRASLDTLRLFAGYSAAQGLAGLALVHGFPRWLA